MVIHRGGCHCGAVRYEVEAPATLDVLECNCTICRMLGYQHLVVPRERFHLVAGETALTTYRFNTRIARHRFCSKCGVKSFYIPRSNPDSVSVNVSCLDEGTVEGMTVTSIDGANDELHEG